MKLLKLMLVLALIIVGLVHRHQTKPKVQVLSETKTAAATVTSVNPELLQNAERLAQTLRRCQQTVQENRATR